MFNKLSCVAQGVLFFIPVTRYKFPVTRNKFPVIGKKFPLTGNRFPLTGNKFPVTRRTKNTGEIFHYLGNTLPATG